MALAPVSIANNVAALTITGVTRIFSASATPAEVLARDCPAMLLDAAEPISGFTVTRESLGADAVAFKMARYTLNYVVMYQEVGAGRALENIAGAMTVWGAVLDALIANSTLGNSANIDSLPSECAIGLVEDAVGNQFWGFKVPIGILEYVNPTT